MCGIAGIYNLDQSILPIKTLERFTDSMSHRGPDGSGYSLLDKETLGLGHRRLSILDLTENGKQPMTYADDRFCITYNGEVFNFIEIRHELLGLGYKFQSDSDTEVILASYLHWGKAFLNKLNGMWALAIWDEENKELFLARDRFGIKPLYYLYEPKLRFAFASETRAFKFLDGYQRQMDESLLALNLQDPYALEGLGYTIFNNILQLLPGHYIQFKRNEKVVQKRWWDISDYIVEVPESLKEQANKFYELFRDACRLRLISDVPVATALSGGLDSTAVYSTVYDILQKETLGRVNKDAQRAFTAVFPGLPHDEKVYAAKAAEYTGGPITYLENNESGLAARIESETELSDFVNIAPISSLSSVYRGMRNDGIVVSLDGHGVDEMLYGYRDMVYALYNDALWNGSMKMGEVYKEVLMNMYHPEQWKEVGLKFDQQLSGKFVRENSLKFKLKKFLKRETTNTEFIPFNLPSLSDKPYDFSQFPLEKRMVYYEFFQHTLPSLLRNFDRAGMMNSVEIRMPFMDWRLVSYVFSLPVESKVGKGFTKLIVREAMAGKMEESLRNRTYKVGIGSPVEVWLNGPLKSWALNRLNNSSLKAKAEMALKKDNYWNIHMVTEIWQSINLDLIRQ